MMIRTRYDIMGMHITVAVVDAKVMPQDIADIFDFFQKIDNQFSTYKKDSEISRYNRKEISEKNMSDTMREIFLLGEQTKEQTNGFFNIQKFDRTIDPSGIVKGWAIQKAAQLLQQKGFSHFYIDAGGDIQTSGYAKANTPWRVGIQHPFKKNQIIKILHLRNKGIATSGTYLRGQHIYNPLDSGSKLSDIVSFTVIGPDVYEADRFATAAFAMQEKGIDFIQKQKDLEGYMIDSRGIATMTTGFEAYLC